MKKLKYLVAAFFIGAVTLTGCGKKETLKPEDAIKKAQDTMKTAENYKMDMSIDVGVKGEGLTLDVNMKLDGTVDVKNGKSKLTMSASLLGEKIETEMYVDSKSEEGKVISYSKNEDDTWTKTVSETEESTDVSEALMSIISSGDNIKSVKADNKDVNTYEITLSADKLASLMEMAGTSDISSIDTSIFKGDVVLKINIDKKTNNITMLYMDMKELLTSAVNSDSDIEIEISKAEFTINFTDFNNAGSVTIPSDIIENADEEVYDYDDYYAIGDFDEDDYDNVLTCTYSGIDEYANADLTMEVGFIDDVATTVYYEAEYTFDSTEESETFYDDYELSENENITRFNNMVIISSTEEASADDDIISYEDAKKEIEGMGFTCE